MPGIRDLGRATIRSRALTQSAERLTQQSLRILAYHGVTDEVSFDRQMDELASRWNPISALDVLDLLDRPDDLEPRSVLVTFDDGDPTVISHGLPILERYGISATLFVCPGLIESGEPFWWDAVDWVVRNDAQPPEFGAHASPVEHLKTIPDIERRALVRMALERIPDGELTSRSATIDELNLWLRSGNQLGSHSWDHPCLDRCTAEQQVEQIEASKRWLDEHDMDPIGLFAYPNGNRSTVVERALADGGYRLGLLHDHRFTKLDTAPLALSRLRVDSEDDLARFRSVLAGVQPAVWRGGLMAKQLLHDR